MSMAGAGMAIGSIGSMIMGPLGSLWSGHVQAKGHEYNARISEMKAKQAKYRADFAMVKTRIDQKLMEERVKRKGEAVQDLVGSQKVAAAKSGASASASTMEVYLDTLVKGAMDQEMMEWSGEVAYLQGQYDSKMIKHEGKMHTIEASRQRDLGHQAIGASQMNAASQFAMSGSHASLLYSQRTTWDDQRTGSRRKSSNKLDARARDWAG